MKILKEIHSLVHSLNKKEKQLFTQLASISGDRYEKRYYRLYQILEKMPVFDEVNLNETIESKLSVKQIAEDKQYLADKLLLTLNLNDKSINKKIQVSKHLSNAFLYKNYNAYNLALRELEKGIELAKEENALAFIYIMTELRYGILGTLNKDVDFKSINLELGNTLEKMQRVQLIANYTIRLRELIQRKNKYSENDFNSAIENIITNWEELNLKPIENETIEFMELNMKMGFYMSSKNYLMALENAERGVEIIERDILTEHMACFTLLNYISNIIFFSLDLNNEVKARYYLKKIYELRDLAKVHKNENLNNEVEYTYLQLKLEIDFFMKHYDLVAAEKDNALLIFKDHSQFVRGRILSLIRVAWSLIYLRDFKNAYFFIQTELIVKEAKENYEFNLSFYVLKSIIEICTFDFITAENTLRNLARFIKLNSSNLEIDNNISKLLNAYLSYKVGKGSKLKIQRQFEKIDKNLTNICLNGLLRFFQYEESI